MLGTTDYQQQHVHLRCRKELRSCLNDLRTTGYEQQDVHRRCKGDVRSCLNERDQHDVNRRNGALLRTTCKCNIYQSAPPPPASKAEKPTLRHSSIFGTVLDQPHRTAYAIKWTWEFRTLRKFLSYYQFHHSGCHSLQPSSANASRPAHMHSNMEFHLSENNASLFLDSVSKHSSISSGNCRRIEADRGV